MTIIKVKYWWESDDDFEKKMPASKHRQTKKNKRIFWQDFSFIIKIVYFLQHVQSDPPTAKSLAQLVSQMIQFQEDYLGMKVNNPPFTRLPVSSKVIIIQISSFKIRIMNFFELLFIFINIPDSTFFGFYSWWTIMSYFICYVSV